VLNNKDYGYNISAVKEIKGVPIEVHYQRNYDAC
jgi:hypothetical protein